MNKKKYIDKRIKTNVSQECIEQYLQTSMYSLVSLDKCIDEKVQTSKY